MAIKKVHRRSDLLKMRADILPLAASTTSTTSQPHAIEPTGPPLYNSASSTHAATTSAPAAGVTPSSSSSSSVVSSASSSSSSVQTSVPTTPPAASNTPNVVPSNTPGNLATRSSTVRVTVSNTYSSATSTSTSADSDSGMGIGSIAGIGVAAVVAIGVGAAFVIWLIKRRNKNRDIDEEPFNRNSYLRHSTAIPDDDDSHLPGVSRPTPAMSERNPTPLYGQQNVQFGGGSDFGYATQPSYGAPVGGMYSPNPFGPGGAPATPLPHSPGYGTNYDQGFGGQPGGYQELTRGGPHDYPPSPGLPMENPHSPGYGNFPMPPHGHEQDMMSGPHGDGVVRSMTPVGHGQVVSVPDGMHEGHATPVQMGFAPPQHPQQQAHGPNGGRQGRPETVYDTDDAYGGI